MQEEMPDFSQKTRQNLHAFFARKKIRKNFEKSVDKSFLMWYNIKRAEGETILRKEYKNGLVVQLVRTLACHARGPGFESPSGRQFASVAQLVEQGTENPRVVGSIPTGGTIYMRI